MRQIKEGKLSKSKYFLGLDAGQTVVKAVLYDENLTQVALSRRSSPMSTPHPRWLERSQDDLWNSARDAISEVIKISSVDPKSILAVGISGHGDGLHLVKKNGEPCGPAIVAVDSRAFAEMEEINTNYQRAHKILNDSGQIPFLGSPGIILKWTQIHEPKRLDGADYFLLCKDVLKLRLTGEISTDYSDASSSFLNKDTALWDEEILREYDLAGLERLFPSLLASSDVSGYVHSAAAEATGLAVGTAVVTGAHDVHASAIGMGALSENILTLVAGSFSINAVTTRQNYVDPRWQNRFSIDPSLRMAMSTSATASTTLEWFFRLVGVTNQLQREELFKEATEVSNADALPIFLPYLYASPFGEKPSGTFAGLRGWHSRGHMLRAVLEGIVSMHVWHCDALSDSFSWDRLIRLGGGLSNSPLYSQLVADALNTDIQVVMNEETGSFGAAALAALGMGTYSGMNEISSTITGAKEYSPLSDNRGYGEEKNSSFIELIADLDSFWNGNSTHLN